MFYPIDNVKRCCHLKIFVVLLKLSETAECQPLACHWQELRIDPLIATFPIKTKMVQKLVESRFKTPTFVTIEVAVRAGQNPADGGLRLLSPIEHLHAFIMALRRDLDNGAPEATITEWARCIRSTAATFRQIESDEAFYLAHLQLREDPGVDHDLVRVTALGRILDVSAFVQRLELVEGKVTPKAPAQLTCASYAGLWRTYLVKCDCFNDRAYSERGWGLRLSFVNSKDGGRHLTWRFEARISKRTSFHFASELAVSMTWCAVCLFHPGDFLKGPKRARE